MTITESDVQWCVQTFKALAVGGVWGVPRSGLIFQKSTEPMVLKLQDVMPYDSAMMPVTAEELKEIQRADFKMIREAFKRAGIEVRDSLDILTLGE